MNDFETLYKRNSVNTEVDFHHSWKFHKNDLKHFQKCIKNLCQNVFAIDVITKFNRAFICVHKMRHINLKSFYFYNELKNDLQTLRLRQRFAYIINLNFII